MTEIGHNRPPDMTETLGQVTDDIGTWLSENPVIQDDKQAKEAKVLLDRGKLGIQDAEAERDSKVRPLNEQVKAVNEYYKRPKEILQKILVEVGNRLSTFIRAEEAKRIAAAEQARREAEAAKAAALQAEQVEQEMLANSAAGELGGNVATATKDADEAFRTHAKATHQAAIKEREIPVKIKGLTRASGLVTKETAVVHDGILAIQTMGMDDDISEAILRSARAYKRLHNRWPAGIHVTTRREIR